MTIVSVVLLEGQAPSLRQREVCNCYRTFFFFFFNFSFFPLKYHSSVIQGLCVKKILIKVVFMYLVKGQGAKY